MTLTLTFMYFICSKMDVIWKFYVCSHYILSYEPILMGLEAISLGNERLKCYCAAFLNFCLIFFLKGKKYIFGYQKWVFFMLSCIFWHFMKKWGKNQKKRQNTAWGIDFPKKLLQTPSKSAHNLVCSTSKRKTFILRPFLSK